MPKAIRKPQVVAHAAALLVVLAGCFESETPLMPDAAKVHPPELASSYIEFAPVVGREQVRYRLERRDRDYVIYASDPYKPGSPANITKARISFQQIGKTHFIGQIDDLATASDQVAYEVFLFQGGRVSRYAPVCDDAILRKTTAQRSTASACRFSVYVEVFQTLSEMVRNDEIGSERFKQSGEYLTR